jgi:hypothetical protein
MNGVDSSSLVFLSSGGAPISLLSFLFSFHSLESGNRTGCIVVAYYIIANAEKSAPTPSIGFPGYVYPNQEICDMYSGIACTDRPDACCYNAALYCSDPTNSSTCSQLDNGAFPLGDVRMFKNQMIDPDALSPFPNAIMWNWATIFILAFGNLAALDFQVRCMAAVNPRAATYGCLIAGCFTIFIGIPFAYLGSIVRATYGPDSIYAEFEADSCLEILGMPTCGQWVPDDMAFIKYLSHNVPPFLGAWGYVSIMACSRLVFLKRNFRCLTTCLVANSLVGLVAASMSTADGAILAMGTVWSHNVTRQLDKWYPNLVTSSNLIRAAQLSTVPFTLAAAMIATKVQATGYLLIVALYVS